MAITLLSYDSLSDGAQRIIKGTLQLEGKYANSPYDAGGETKYGITKNTARAHGYLGAMSELPISMAYDIYATSFWANNGMEDVYAISPKMAECIFDMGVNHGQSGGWGIVQRALNASNRGEDWPDVIRTNTHDPLTMTALEKSIEIAGEDLMYKIFNMTRFVFFLQLAERRTTDEQNINGWIANRVKWV